MKNNARLKYNKPHSEVVELRIQSSLLLPVSNGLTTGESFAPRPNDFVIDEFFSDETCTRQRGVFKWDDWMVGDR